MFTYFPYAIVGMVVLNLLTGFGFTVAWFVLKSKIAVSEEKCNVEYDED